MRALAIEDDGVIRVRDVPVPAGAGECLIKVRMAGICGTDLVSDVLPLESCATAFEEARRGLKVIFTLE